MRHTILLAATLALSPAAARASLVYQDDAVMVFSQGTTHTKMWHLTGWPDCDLVVTTTASRVVLDRTEPSLTGVYTDGGPEGVTLASPPTTAATPETLSQAPPASWAPPSDVPGTPVSPVPLPPSLALAGGALALLALLGRATRHA